MTASTATISKTDNKAAPRSEGFCVIIRLRLFQRSVVEHGFAAQPEKACVGQAYRPN
jgi:hypothetical protein